MINWLFFSKNQLLDEVSYQVVKAFQNIASGVDSESHHHKMDEVLAIVHSKLKEIGFEVEKSKRSETW